MQARKTVLIKTPSGKLVNTIDISRILKDYPILAHQFVQEKNYNCKLNLKFIYSVSAKIKEEIKQKILTLFNHEVSLMINDKIELFQGKVIPYISNLD